MNGNILTQNSWKVTVVFTLTVLFATTCLLLTDLPAEVDCVEQATKLQKCMGRSLREYFV